MKFALVVVLALFLSGCGLIGFYAQNISRLLTPPKRSDAGLAFSLTSKEADRIRKETYEKILHKPYPPEEGKMRQRAKLLNSSPELETEGKPAPKPLVSPEGFPLVSLRGENMTLGDTLEFAAGSAGYIVEWGDGVNLALPVRAKFEDEPLDKVVTTLLKPFGYCALVDGKKGVVKVGVEEIAK